MLLHWLLFLHLFVCSTLLQRRADIEVDRLQFPSVEARWQLQRYGWPNPRNTNDVIYDLNHHTVIATRVDANNNPIPNAQHIEMDLYVFDQQPDTGRPVEGKIGTSLREAVIDPNGGYLTRPGGRRLTAIGDSIIKISTPINIAETFVASSTKAFQHGSVYIRGSSANNCQGYAKGLFDLLAIM